MLRIFEFPVLAIVLMLVLNTCITKRAIFYFSHEKLTGNEFKKSSEIFRSQQAGENELLSHADYGESHFILVTKKYFSASSRTFTSR